ncbi:hypothetical protein SEA_GARDENSTATE_34 [Microbacterium phage GardenState]|uniref:Uncharacterized protein n=2 Tax=Gardenstatevirus TaxID=3425012 RepID=A0A4Y6E718_9CAUD|nr:hypothetical protein SEA_IAMGROOT_34 [Microbacterium phage IAmGroot]QOI66946.1 hypothetical protein SEA_GARDENSTATE_34 [Microbacterium phage GardenState]
MNPTITPGVYLDREGDTWAVLADGFTLQLSQREPAADALHAHHGGALPVAAIAEHARHGGVRVELVALAFGPLTPLHLFEAAA